MSVAEPTAPVSRRVHHITPTPSQREFVADLWQARDLIQVLSLRDIKIRYTQTALGAGWAIIQPLLFMGVFAAVVSRVASVETAGIAYPLFALSGLVPWVFLSNAVPRAADSVVSSSNMVGKVWFPRLALPLAAVLAWLPDMVVATVLLGCGMAIGTTAPSPAIVLLPLVAAWAVLVALGLGSWLSALNVRFRDIRNVVPFLVQVWLFATPVAYPSSVATGWPRMLFGLNPASGVVESFRWCVFGGAGPSALLLLPSVASTLVILAGGIRFFTAVEHKFADVI